MADNAGTIDSLQIDIGASSDKAVNDIEKVVSSLKKLKAAQQEAKKSGFGKGGNLFKDMDADSVQAMSKIELLRKKLAALKSDFADKMKLGMLDDKGIANAALQIKNIQSQVQGEIKKAQDTTRKEAEQASAKGMLPQFNDASDLLTNIRQIGKELSDNVKPAMTAFGNMLKSAVQHAVRLGKSIGKIAFNKIKTMWNNSAFAGIERSLSRINKVVSSFGRIAFYRAVRSAIKYITDALKEGTENAYWFAQEFGTVTHYIAEAFDRLASSNFKMSNQLGAAWATLIATIEPILIQIINLVTRAADAVTQLFALLSGRGTYLKAVDYNRQWADSAGGAAKAAEEWKNQLMGFDEINRLEAPSDPSGGGGGNKPTDYENMFEEMPVSDFFKEIKDAFENGKWHELGQLLGNKVNEMVDSIPWAKLGQKFGKGLQGIISTGYSFLKTVDFVNIGSRISEFINNALANIDFEEAGRLWMRLRLVLFDVIYGAIKTLDWKAIAVSLSNYIIGSLNELAEWLEGLDPIVIANALRDFFGNIKYQEIYESLKTVIKSALDLLGDVVGELIPEDLGENVKGGIVDAIKKADFAAIHNVLAYKLDVAVFGEKWAKFWWSRGDYAGKDIVMGIINGTTASTPDLKNTFDVDVKGVVDGTLGDCKRATDNYGKDYQSFVWNLDGMNTDMARSATTASASVSGTLGDISLALDGVSGAAWSMAQNGGSAMSSLDAYVQSSGQNIFTNLMTLREAAMDVWNWLRAIGDKGQARIDANGGIWNSLGGFATGGFPEDGLFFANHSELVGQFSNGKTAVANNEQITAGIASAVYDAFMTAFTQTNGSGNGGQPVNIYLDGRQIAQTTTKYQKQFARASGT